MKVSEFENRRKVQFSLFDYETREEVRNHPFHSCGNSEFFVFGELIRLRPIAHRLSYFHQFYAVPHTAT